MGELIGIAQGTISNALGGDEPKSWQFDYVQRVSYFLDIALPDEARVRIVVEAAKEANGRDGVRAMLTAFETLLLPRS